MPEKLLVISAHAGDFVWRSAGTIAKYTKKGSEVYVLVLTYGARGESAGYYKKENATLEECKQVRRQEAQQAAEVLGVKEIAFCGYDDFPLYMDDERVLDLAKRICSINPDIIISHDKGMDTVNPDHTKTAVAALKALSLAKNVGCFGEAALSKPVAMFGFEPMSPERCYYTPEIYIDITEEFETKQKAMECLKTQKGSIDSYVQKAILRASYVSGRGGNANCKHAESFSMYNQVYVYDKFVW